MTRRHHATIFIAIVILQLVPIWSVHYLPTVDGPSHVYNAWVLHELVSGRSAFLSQTFRVNWSPQPNWIGSAVMALLMTIVPPTIAEKIFVSAIVLLFSLAMWLYAGAVDRRRAIAAFLALPFTYNWLLQAGFYNFSIGVAMAFITIAIWWRRRDQPNATTIVSVALLLIVCYFAHPMAVLFACGAIGLMWLTTRGDIKLLGVFLPVLPLLFWYVRQPATIAISGGYSSFGDLCTMLFGARIAWTFDRAQMILGAATFALIVLLIVVRAARELRRFREEDVFLLLTILVAIVYFVTPTNAAGGLFLRERLTLFIYLTPLAWITIPRWSEIFVRAIAVVAIANIVYLIICYRSIEPRIEHFVRGVDPVRPDSTIVAVVNLHLPTGGNISVLSHAIDYAATEHRLIDVNDYEADSGLFPIGFRNTSPMIDIENMDVAMWSLHVDYVYAYRLPGDDKLARALRRYFRPIRIAGDAWLSERALPHSTADETLVLLPIAGTTSEVGAPLGIRFRIDQTMHNSGTTPIHVITSSCALTPSCAIDLGPGRSVALAGEPDKPPYILVIAPRGQARQLDFSTIVRRTDDPNALPPISVPAINEGEFARGRIVIPNVPTDAPMNLRVWFFGRPVPPNFRVRAYASRSGAPLGEATYALWPNGYATTTGLDHDFKYRGESATFIIEPSQHLGDDERMWAFITTTDYRNGRTTLSLPR